MAQPSTLDLFADELRRARAAADLSQEGLSQAINYSASLVAKVELSQRRPTRDFAQRCDAVLDTGGLLTRIHDVLPNDAVMPWLRPWVAVEREAVALRSFEWSVVPGLLQTGDYARALLAGGALLMPDEVEQQVAARLERQEVLTRERPPHFTAVLDERVLRHPVGGSRVMRDQLAHLVKVSADNPRVRLHVVPGEVGSYAGLNGPFVLASPPESEDVAYVDDQVGGRVLDRPDEVATIRRAWESVRGEALPHRRSSQLIREVAETWT